MGGGGSKEVLPLKLIHESRWQLVSCGSGASSSETSLLPIKLKTPEGITLTLHEGKIASQQVDAIVNSTDTSLQLDVDPLSRSILEAGGDTLRDECQKNAPNGKLEYGEVVVTSGGQLQCKFVIHGAACKWTDGNCKEVLGRFVANSLKEAHKKNIASIAFPILGTGDIPTDVIGEVMFDELCEFCCSEPKTKLRDVRFVVHPEDDKAAQEFQKLLFNRCFGMTVETGEGLTLSMCVADLAYEQVSLVVNSAGEELRLHRGQASKALLEKAGKKLQAKCDEIAPKGIKFGEVVVTPGYELQSAFVVHGACCGWTAGETTCERVLGEFITNSFKVAHEKEMTGIAFPAIGTGELNMPPDFVAKIMIDELLKFSQQYKQTTLENVRFILYFTNLPAMKGFSKTLRSSCNVLPDPTPSGKDYFPLPSGWAFMESGQKYKVEPLHTTSSEYQMVVNLFKPGTNYDIKKIERVQNPKLYRQFMIQKKDMRKHTDATGIAHRRLWHGTSKEAADSINLYGFNRSYSGTSVGALYGNGTYFATESSYSAGGGYSKPDGSGLKRMYLARVLTGVYTVGKKGLKVPPDLPGEDKVMYDSVVDNVSNPTMFVVFNDCQAYPEYLVSFK